MSDATTTAAIDQPFTLPNGTVLGNRLVKAALSEQLGTLRNAPTRQLETLYRRWSAGRFGLVITGNVMVDRRALGEPRNVVVEDERDLSRLQAWASAARVGGNAAWVQINHPGRQSPRVLSDHPVAPSPVGLKISGQFARPRALTSPEIHEIIDRFATTAAIAVKAGFDGVQIHSAHGYLSSQFLSPITNQRTDEWGGDPERRMRFLLEVVRATRERIGPEAGLGVKLNSADFQRGGFTEEESMGVVDALSAEGHLDLLEISGGTYEKAAMMGVVKEQRESTKQREAYFLDYAEAVRTRASMPLMLTGGLRSRTAMDEALAGGAIDLVGLGRPTCVDPAIAGKLIDGTLPAIPPARELQIGVKTLDDLSELTWYTTQLWRLGRGKDAAAQRHPAPAVAEYLAQTVFGGATRRLQRPPRY
ncbi:MAG: NADH:flavin oxidoreductase/NADH oxidase family protein [Patulibacter sp.]|nr:NADH:flavin oxidoreductase/NADH oxidase family protein [Patulibacter sp.]